MVARSPARLPLRNGTILSSRKPKLLLLYCDLNCGGDRLGLDTDISLGHVFWPRHGADFHAAAAEQALHCER